MILIQNQKFGGAVAKKYKKNCDFNTKSKVWGGGVSKSRIFDGLIMTYKKFLMLTPYLL